MGRSVLEDPTSQRLISCVDKVVLGAHDLKYVCKNYSVAHVYRHPKFMPKDITFSNDIHLLKSKVRRNENIRILPLPTSSRDLSEGTHCTVAGWSPNEENCPYMLYAAYASIYDRRKCQKFYPKIDRGKICAGHQYQGEMGDPLVCNGVAHGILSYSNPCPPAVYTRIAQYLPWIKKTMAK
ncbi:mast cell protease 1A-like [Podarcis lilfordi]|uniref:Mast cell protease 1A-like n=1 Tax=Podarcis lilfordi TaxID=74358 RepID=A0AA35LMG0_9SAUR|nr:mast cell protease 1A-like [Podarcis lilfordi]